MEASSFVAGTVATHITAGVVAALLVFAIEFVARKWLRRRALRRLSWLFPISQSNAEMYFKCSLKPNVRYRFTESSSDLFTQFFGRNPPTFRNYVHSAEVLALQLITESLSPLGVKFSQASFYSGGEPNQNVLLIGSESNNDMSKTVLDLMHKRIDRVEPIGGGHKYF